MATTTAQETLLSEVLATFRNAPNERLREVITSLVRHLHGFADEVHLTQAEWMFGLHFLTAVGKASSESRQEFILLSDVLGLSSLVEMINFQGDAGATENTVLGPFYIEASPRRANGDSIIVNEDGGPHLRVSGVVRSTDGSPIAGATVDVWQGGSNGLYPVQDPTQDPLNLRGVFTTDADGRYEFVTLRPVVYPVPTDGPVGRLFEATGRHPNRAAHTHLIISAPGYYSVTTHIFDSESPYLDSDAVFGVRDSLIVKFEKQPDGSFTADFDVSLTPKA
ncbi:MAG TPA: dioxygenase [Dehalococcoidia bacterium]|nr:dioxygenase [Dehalococcoidia bacterium]